MDEDNANEEISEETGGESQPEAQPEERSILLGGNIELSGFKELDGASMIILKKIVGNQAKRFSELGDFERLSLKMKAVHKTEKSEKYEIHGTLKSAGQHIHAEAIDRNLFFAVDKVLKRLGSEAEPKKRHGHEMA